MSEQIQAYQTAGTEFQAAIRRVEALAATVRRGGESLLHYQTAMVSNVSVGFPPEVELSGDSSRNINGSEWPTGQQIAEALQAYHQSKARLRNAYDAIPASQRDVIKPPPV